MDGGAGGRRAEAPDMRNESGRGGARKTYRFVPAGMSHGALIYRTVFFPHWPLVVTLISALIGSDVDLEMRSGVAARLLETPCLSAAECKNVICTEICPLHVSRAAKTECDKPNSRMSYFSNGPTKLSTNLKTKLKLKKKKREENTSLRLNKSTTHRPNTSVTENHLKFFKNASLGNAY